jgi:hypothetical protein
LKLNKEVAVLLYGSNLNKKQLMHLHHGRRVKSPSMIGSTEPFFTVHNKIIHLGKYAFMAVELQIFLNHMQRWAFTSLGL